MFSPYAPFLDKNPLPCLPRCSLLFLMFQTECKTVYNPVCRQVQDTQCVPIEETKCDKVYEDKCEVTYEVGSVKVSQV